MPILFDDLMSSAKQITTYTPKFFDQKLTGNGKGMGVLSTKMNPVNVKPGLPTTTEHRQAVHKKYVNGDTDVRIIPVNPIGYNAWLYMDTLNRPRLDNMVCILEGKNNNGIPTVYFTMDPHSVVMEETRLPASQSQNMKSHIKREVTICYQAFLFAVVDDADQRHVWTVNDAGLYNVAMGKATAYNHAMNAIPVNTNNTFMFHMTCDPIAWANEQLNNLISRINVQHVAHTQELSDYFTAYSAYDALCRRSEQWQTNIDEILLQYFRNITGNKTYESDNVALNEVARTLTYLENYPVPLNLCRKIYQDITSTFKPDTATVLCKQNLNLLLSDTLNDLDKNKATIPGVQPPPPGTVMPASVQRLSAEQKAAVTSPDPLVLVQSGAGTGKAHPLNTPILTPSGWRPLGELKIGDMVIGSDGKAHAILKIHERGLLPGYHLTLLDGAEIDACGEHLWTVCYNDNGKTCRDTITTKEWITNRKYNTYAYLPPMPVVEYEYGEKNLPIDPYFLGALLANGDLTKNAVRYIKSETAVCEKTALAAARDGYTIRDCTFCKSAEKQWRFSHPGDNTNHSVLDSNLQSLGLTVLPHDKFVPEIYKTASPAQRRELLRGLFDNSGNIRTGRGYARFITASEKLADDALQLLWSLGLSADKQHQVNSGENRWFVNLLDTSWDPFVASAYAGKCSNAIRPTRRGLKSAEPFDPIPMRCIEIDAPDHLYVANDFVLTHNSTTILSRVDYMIASGIKPEDIMVLSFTNAAADHIKDKNPDIHSMTIARMIHTIYSENFPNHELSTLDTIINSLDIYYPDDDLAIRFKKRCIDVNKNTPGSFILINSFVEMHYDAVVAMLDTLRQTSLELEIIICYQQIDYLKEPDTVKSKYLIIDEVQDNSIFEFIYTLRYVRKHAENLFIVGDCSQTLFEFRGSEPKALNVMEGSGVFSTFQLQVNYRSNQEILDFANVLLQKIEANQYAQIQLQANILTTVTAQTFTEKVKLHYVPLRKKADLPNMLPTIFANELRPYLDQKLAAGQQVAFLAHTRRMVYQLQAHLEKLYPTGKIVNMIPEKSYNSTVFSMFIRNYWDTITFVPTKNITDVIENAILTNVTDLIPHMDSQKAMTIALAMIIKWKMQYQADIDGWARAYLAGTYSLDQFMDNVKACMLDFEISMNAVKQKMVSMRNEEAKKNQDIQSANFLLSTIHSAKGLEFDNVVLFYDDTDKHMEEPDKRMYYVGFTRAMLSEFIVAYGVNPNPRIQMDYEFIVNQLKTKAPAQPNQPVTAPATSSTPTPASAAPPAPAPVGTDTPNAPATVTEEPVPPPSAPSPDSAAQSALSACGYTFSQSPNIAPPNMDDD